MPTYNFPKGKILTNLIYRVGVSLLFVSWLFLSQARTVQAKTELKFDPAQLNLTPNQTTTVNLNISSTVNIFGTDLIIKYDPTAIIIDKVTPGGFWQQPQVLINQNDSSTGKVALSVFHYPARLGNGSVITLSLRPIGNKNSTISLDKLTTFALEKGQKVDYTADEMSIVITNPTVTTIPTGKVVPTSLPTSFVSQGTDSSPVNIGATVATTASETQNGPTIILEQSPTPIVESTKASSSFILQIVALFLLIFGTLAFFTFKKNF